MSAGVTSCLPPVCAGPCRVRASVCACRSSSISISYSLPNSGQYARPALKEAVSLMKACMSLALCGLCSATERIHDPDLSVSEM